jgi:PAS domain S-box-containing protein
VAAISSAIALVAHGAHDDHDSRAGSRSSTRILVKEHGVHDLSPGSPSEPRHMATPPEPAGDIDSLISDLSRVEPHIGAGLVVFDADACVRLFNDRALALAGLTAPPLGEHISRLDLGDEGPRLVRHVQAALDDGTPADLHHTCNARTWNAHVCAWHGGGSRILGAILSVHDVTPLVEANARLQVAEESLRSLNARQQATLDSIEANVALLDGRGVVVAVNSSWQAFGRDNGLVSANDAVGTDYLHVCDRAVGSSVAGASAAADGIRDVLQGRADRFVFEYPCDSPTVQRWFRCYVTPARQMQSPGAVVLHLDITESRRLLERVHRQATALETAANAICISDVDGVLDWTNPAFSGLTGLHAGDRVDTSAMVLTTPSGLRFGAVLRECARTGEPWRGETVLHRAGTDEVYAQQTTSPIRQAIGQVQHFVTILEDITGQKQAQRGILYMAEHDQLTGLLNRKSFIEQLSGRLLADDEDSGRVAVAFLDLDDFKAINDSQGHHAGDLLLTAVAQRLRQRVRSADAVARLGGDEFMLYIDHCASMTMCDTPSRASSTRSGSPSRSTATGSPSRPASA